MKWTVGGNYKTRCGYRACITEIADHMVVGVLQNTDEDRLVYVEWPISGRYSPTEPNHPWDILPLEPEIVVSEAVRQACRKAFYADQEFPLDAALDAGIAQFVKEQREAGR